MKLSENNPFAATGTPPLESSVVDFHAGNDAVAIDVASKRNANAGRISDDILKEELTQRGKNKYMELVQLETFDQIIQYWSQNEHRAELNQPVMVITYVNILLNTAYCAYESDDTQSKALFYRIRRNAFFLIQCCDKHTPFEKIITIFNSSDTLEEFLSWMPVLHYQNSHQTSVTIMKNMIDPSSIVEECNQSQFTISFATSGNPADRVEYTIGRHSLLKWIVRAYSRDMNVPWKSVRLVYEGNHLFLSSSGKKTAEELGLKQGSVIMASNMEHSSGINKLNKNKTTSDKPRSLPSKKTRKGTGKKKPQKDLYSVTSEEERFKQQHSKALSFVFGECATRFKSIRERLNAMNLKRTEPKPKRKCATSDKPLHVIANSTSHVGGRAGKSHSFLVQVGEASNIYKTSKPSAGRNHESLRRAAGIDLRGLTKADALSKLDALLPKWVDAAMEGQYPFIMPVKIICGGGNQILAEAVAGWIQKTKQVANAPKSMYS